MITGKENMKNFVDVEGREWDLSLTYGDIRRVISSTKHNLAIITDRAYREEELSTMAIDQYPLILRLSVDPMTLLDIVFALVQPQAKKLGVSKDAFEASITPPIFQTVRETFWEVYEDFFLQAGEPAKAEMLKTVKGLGQLEPETSNEPSGS